MDLLRATAADAEAMAAIHAMAFPPGEAWSPEVFSLQLALPNVLGLMHPDGGVLLLRVAADEGEILTLGVTPVMRRHGIAKMLLREAVACARFAGVRVLFLEVSEANDPARTLYCAAGFREVGRRRLYYANGSDAVVMRAELSSAA